MLSGQYSLHGLKYQMYLQGCKFKLLALSSSPITCFLPACLFLPVSSASSGAAALVISFPEVAPLAKCPQHVLCSLIIYSGTLSLIRGCALFGTCGTFLSGPLPPLPRASFFWQETAPTDPSLSPPPLPFFLSFCISLKYSRSEERRVG